MNPPAILPHLHQLSSQIRDVAATLLPAPELGPENVGYVTGTAQELEETVRRLAGGPPNADPLDSRDLRHDLRNKVAVIKGFSDLMQMDLDAGSPWTLVLTRLIDLSDQFVELLDHARDRSPADCGAAIFA